MSKGGARSVEKRGRQYAVSKGGARSVEDRGRQYAVSKGGARSVENRAAVSSVQGGCQVRRELGEVLQEQQPFQLPEVYAFCPWTPEFSNYFFTTEAELTTEKTSSFVSCSKTVRQLNKQHY